jgi:hypothetical protein
LHVKNYRILLEDDCPDKSDEIIPPRKFPATLHNNKLIRRGFLVFPKELNLDRVDIEEMIPDPEYLFT